MKRRARARCRRRAQADMPAIALAWRAVRVPQAGIEQRMQVTNAQPSRAPSRFANPVEDTGGHFADKPIATMIETRAS